MDLKWLSLYCTDDVREKKGSWKQRATLEDEWPQEELQKTKRRAKEVGLFTREAKPPDQHCMKNRPNQSYTMSCKKSSGIQIPKPSFHQFQTYFFFTSLLTNFVNCLSFKPSRLFQWFITASYFTCIYGMVSTVYLMLVPLNMIQPTVLLYLNHNFYFLFDYV